MGLTQVVGDALRAGTPHARGGMEGGGALFEYSHKRQPCSREHPPLNFRGMDVFKGVVHTHRQKYGLFKAREWREISFLHPPVFQEGASKKSWPD